MKIDFGT